MTKRIAIALFGLALAAGDARAVTTKAWTTSTYKDFDEGEGSGTLISSVGEVTIGRGTDRVDLETDSMWTAVRADDGTVYAGSVTDGTIYAISGGKMKKLATLDKDVSWIGALALDGNTTLYAGTVGTGQIFSIDVRSGRTQEVVKLDGSKHVWAIAIDGKNLWVAGGASGQLFSVDVPARKATKVWDSGDTQILSLLKAKDGAVWVGTADEALLYRYDPKTKDARAIADFAGTEVKAILEVEGGFVVAVNEFAAQGGTPSAAPSKGPKGTAAKTPEAGTTPGADSKSPDPSRSGERKGKGALFRVEADGRTEQLHALADSYFTDLAAGENGSVYASAGSQGRVYQVKADRTVVTAFDVDERQVNAVMTSKDGKNVSFVTGDTAAYYVSNGAAKDAKYTSKVFDAGFPARWGNLRWRGTGVAVETRSGNTAKPDKGWSAWQKLGGAAKAGGDAMTGAVGSPTGRYLQYRVAFTDAAVLHEAVVYYLPQNQRARVTDITIGDGTDPAARAPVTTAGGAAKPRSPIVKLKWKVENPDNDELVYTVEYRAEGAAEWQPVPTGSDPLLKAEFDWNTEALPDGYYRLRVTASDSRANPRDLAMENTFVGTPFLIDNQKPMIAGLEVKYPYVSGRATDSFSRIDELAYQIDGGDWVMAFPKDGLFDDLSEVFTIKLPDLKPGTHTLGIRTADEADNIGAASVSFKVAK